MLATDNVNAVALVLLDLSSSFDIVDHTILFFPDWKILGIQDTFLNWFHSGMDWEKKQPGIFSQIGPPQLQTAATISQYYSNQCISFMGNNITKPTVTLLKKTIETSNSIRNYNGFH